MGRDELGWVYSYVKWGSLGLIAWCTLGAIGTTVVAAII